MIKITDKGIQGSNVVLTVVFTDINGIERTKSPSFSIAQVVGKTQQEIVDLINSRVETFRGQQASDDVDALFNEILNIDIEQY